MIRHKYKAIGVTAWLNLALLFSQWCGVICAFPAQAVANPSPEVEQSRSHSHCHQPPAPESSAEHPSPPVPSNQNHQCSHHDAPALLSAIYSYSGNSISPQPAWSLPEPCWATCGLWPGKHSAERWDGRRAPPRLPQRFILRI